MTRQEKIAFIKEVAAGRVDGIQKLKESIREKERRDELKEKYIVPAFLYLVENGRIRNWGGIAFFPLLQESDLPIMLEGLKVYEQEGIAKVPDRALEILAEVLMCFDTFYDNDQLNLLDKYLERA